MTFERPLIALMVGYGFSVSYKIVAVVGVWRSAGRDQAPAMNRDSARGAVVVLMGVLSLI